MGSAAERIVSVDARRTWWWADFRLWIWHLLLLIAGPFLIFNKIRRFIQWRKVDDVHPSRWLVKVANPEAHAALHRAEGIHLLFVGASFGELLLIQKLDHALKERHSSLRTTWVLRDHQSVADAVRYHPQQDVIFWPFDFVFPVASFLGKTRPDAAVFIERYRFTTLVTSLAGFGARMVLINGRIKQRYGWFGKLTLPYERWIAEGFCGMFLQQQAYLDGAKAIAPPGSQVRVTGDVKFDLDRKALPAEQALKIDQWLSQGSTLPLLAAGSTDGVPEEEVVLDAFMQVRGLHPCRLLLAPRRPQRKDEVLKLIAQRGLSVSLRSEGGGEADVYLLDTLGELSYAYKHSTAAYVGGAYDGMGHNVIEPVEWGVPVSYGMRRGHFETMQKLCESYGVGFRISDASSLALHWKQVLEDESLREQCHEEGKAMLIGQRGAFLETLSGIEESLNLP